MRAILLLALVALGTSIVKADDPVVFDVDVTCNSAFTTTGKTELNAPEFVSVGVGYSVNNDGGADPLPELPAGYAILKVNGIDQYFPFYNAPVSPQARSVNLRGTKKLFARIRARAALAILKNSEEQNATTTNTSQDM